MGGWAAVDTPLAQGCRLCVHVCLCKPDLPAGDGCDPRPTALGSRFHSEGLGKGAWEYFGLSRGEQGRAWAAELVLGWAVSTGSSDGTLGSAVLSGPSLSQCRAGSPTPHPDSTAQAAQNTPISSKPNPMVTHTHKYVSCQGSGIYHATRALNAVRDLQQPWGHSLLSCKGWGRGVEPSQGRHHPGCATTGHA